MTIWKIISIKKCNNALKWCAGIYYKADLQLTRSWSWWQTRQISSRVASTTRRHRRRRWCTHHKLNWNDNHQNAALRASLRRWYYWEDREDCTALAVYSPELTADQDNAHDTHHYLQHLLSHNDITNSKKTLTGLYNTLIASPTRHSLGLHSQSLD